MLQGVRRFSLCFSALIDIYSLLHTSAYDTGDEAYSDPLEERIKPQVFIAGVTKAGSSSLYEWLCRHPHFLPIESKYLLPKKVRLRLASTWLDKFGNKKNQMTSWNKDRFLRTGEFTEEEVLDAEVKPLRPEEFAAAPSLRSALTIQHLVQPIMMSKETRYFTSSILRSVDTLSGHDPALAAKWFLDIFPRRPNNADVNVSYMTGEASPHYIEGSESANEIKKMFPSAKIIMLLREPVSKLRSMALFRRDDRWMDTDIEERREMFHGRVKDFMADVRVCMEKGLKLPLHIGKCVEHRLGEALVDNHPIRGMVKFLQVFSKDSLYILPCEKLWASPVSEMHALTEWLGLRRMDDAFWENVTSTIHRPYRSPEDGLFHTKQIHVTQGRKSEKNKSAAEIPEDFDSLFRDIFKHPNCMLRKLLGVDWSEYGWTYCSDDFQTGKGETQTATTKQVKAEL